MSEKAFIFSENLYCIQYVTLEIYWIFKSFYIFGNILKISKLKWLDFIGKTFRQKTFPKFQFFQKPFRWPFYRIGMNISPLGPNRLPNRPKRPKNREWRAQRGSIESLNIPLGFYHIILKIFFFKNEVQAWEKSNL